MWITKLCFVAAAAICTLADSFTTPRYIKPCARNAPDFRECCIKHGNDALPFLLKGDRALGIPVMLPLKVPKVKLDAGSHLNIQLTDMSVFGLDTTVLRDMEVDFDQKRIKLELSIPKLELIGDYDVDGKIMVLPIQGKGPINITAVGGYFKYSFPFKIETIKGVEYGIVTENDNKLEFTLQKAYFHLDNLFNGDEKLGNNVNVFLNENWQEVIKELGGAVEGTVSAIAIRIGGGVLRKIPYKELFSD